MATVISTIQSPVSDCITQSAMIIPAGLNSVVRRHIRIKAFWIEVTGNPTMVSLRWGQYGSDMFPKTQTGLAGMNLIEAGIKCQSPACTPLWIHIEGNCTVCFTIVFEYV